MSAPTPITGIRNTIDGWHRRLTNDAHNPGQMIEVVPMSPVEVAKGSSYAAVAGASPRSDAGFRGSDLDMADAWMANGDTFG